MQNSKWFSPESDFFGPFYQKGDNSLSGYRSVPQTQDQRTKEEVEGIVRLLKLGECSTSPPLICDCPCGVGRHSLRLAQLGFHVIGLDCNTEQLSVAHAGKMWLHPEDRVIFQLGDMINLNCDPKFDAVINMFFSFGFFETNEENEQVARNFYNLLKPSGKFLMHTDVNMARVRNGTYKFTETRPLKNGESLEIMERYNSHTKRIEGIWSIEDGKHRCEARRYSVRVYENGEFVDLCQGVGFKNVKIYSDWHGAPYNEESEMIIFVAEK